MLSVASTSALAIRPAMCRPALTPSPARPATPAHHCSPGTTSTQARRHVCTAASKSYETVVDGDRRSVLLSVAALGLAACSAHAPAAVAAYGSASREGDVGSDEASFITFYGAASPPATYGSLGGTVKSKAKYCYDVPSTWVEEATSKVEKGTGGQDSRWVAPGSRGKTKAVLLTLNRAGQDGAAYQLTGTALNAVAAADSSLQAVLQSGNVGEPVTSVEDGQEYVTYDIESAQHYVIKAAIDNTGRLFAFIVTAPERTFQQERKTFDRMVSSFKTFRNASQFV